LRVPHRAAGAVCHQLQRLLVRLHAFRGDDLLEALDNARQPMPAKSNRWQRDRIVTESSDIRRREDELHVRRRLFQGLEQRIERCRGQHVDFVDDVNLCSGRGWAETDVGAQVAHFIDAVVAGRRRSP